MNVWKTGHEICDTVAASLAIGLRTRSKHISEFDRNELDGQPNIAYGILRGTCRIFRESSAWFNVDNGFWGAGHYAGNYRISYRGTQPRYTAGIEANIALDAKPFRSGNHIMIVPPSAAVCMFFGIDYTSWLRDAIAKCDKPYFIKHKDGSAINFEGVAKIITFNSSLGWNGLIEGIEVDSDPQHSVVGSYYATKYIDTYEKFIQIEREPLFRFMRAHQFTLREIEHGDAGWLIKHYLSISDGTHEKQSVPMSQRTASDEELN